MAASPEDYVRHREHLSTWLQDWANNEWVAPGYKNQNHYHECTGCRERMCCQCDDALALWTTCTECESKAA